MFLALAAHILASLSKALMKMPDIVNSTTIDGTIRITLGARLDVFHVHGSTMKRLLGINAVEHFTYHYNFYAESGNASRLRMHIIKETATCLNRALAIF
jgi:hypothetical protein